MMPLRYHEAAEEELLNEIVYLELQAQGLGRRFFAEIRRAEGRILPSSNTILKVISTLRLNLKAKASRSCPSLQ